MEPDAGHSHDPYSEASIYPEPRLRFLDIADLYGDCSTHDYSIYSVWENAGLCGTAGNLFCLPDSVYPAIYGISDKPEKGLCTALWRAALKRRN